MPKGKDDKAKPARNTEDEMPMFALGAWSSADEPLLGRDDDTWQMIDSVVESIQLGDKEEATRALYDLVAFIVRRPHHDNRSRIAEIETRQSTYLAASGTLTQFNGILAAALAGALATLEFGSLRYAIVAALVMHVLAAFVLCWAARPVNTKREPSPAMALLGQVALVDHTFRNYQRGWRMTMIALAVTSVAGALFALRYFGVEIGSLLRTLFA